MHAPKRLDPERNLVLPARHAIDPVESTNAHKTKTPLVSLNTLHRGQASGEAIRDYTNGSARFVAGLRRKKSWTSQKQIGLTRQSSGAAWCGLFGLVMRMDILNAWNHTQ